MLVSTKLQWTIVGCDWDSAWSWDSCGGSWLGHTVM
jgi:hypothetical protein